jgi:probable HAF family extracellular repeat protein
MAPWWSAWLKRRRAERAFRWTAARGMQDLGTLGGVGARLEAFPPMAPWWSASWNAAGQERAFRWTAARGMQDLGTLGGDESGALGVSADGSVVVGVAENAAGRRRAFRWTAAGGMQDLGTLGGSGSAAMAFPPMAPWWSARLETPQGSACLSLDGGAWDAGPRHAGRRWSWANGVSADGSVVVGGAENAAGQRVPFAGRRRVAWRT